MSSARFFFASIVPAFAYAHFFAMEPILAERLVGKHLTTMQIGLFFTIFPIVYITCNFTAYCIPQKIEKRVVLILSFVSFCIAYLLIGPS